MFATLGSSYIQALKERLASNRRSFDHNNQILVSFDSGFSPAEIQQRQTGIECLPLIKITLDTKVSVNRLDSPARVTSTIISRLTFDRPCCILNLGILQNI